MPAPLRTPSARPGGARSRRARWGLAVPLVALAAVAAACGSSDELKGTVVKDGIGCQPTEVDRSTDAPTVAKTKVGKDVGTKDDPKGKGCTIAAESFLSLDLVGATAADGKVFSSTWKTGHPITAQLGQGQLLAGLETGLDGMRVGGQRTITIPSKQGYGAEGNPAQGIGKDADLVFVVELLGVTSEPRYCSEARDIPTEVDGKPVKDKPTDIKMPVEVPGDEVRTKTLEEGDGEKVGKDRYVTVDYLGISCVSGRQFDASFDRGEPITVALGTAEPNDAAFSVIPGWSTGLEEAKVGGLYQLEIPYPLAYGAEGRPPDIAVKDSLVFVIKVEKVTDKAPKPPATTTTTAPEGQATTTTTAPEGEGTTTTSAPEGDGSTTTTTASAGDETTTTG